jgi:sensor histidine kinase regulating citrate/malate metabolism
MFIFLKEQAEDPGCGGGEDMKKAVIKNNKKSISKKILLILVAMVLGITVLIGSVSIVEHRQEVIALKTEQSTIVGKMAAAYADGDQLAILAASHKETDYYQDIKKILSDIKTATGVKYLYAVVPLPETRPAVVV